MVIARKVFPKVREGMLLVSSDELLQIRNWSFAIDRYLGRSLGTVLLSIRCVHYGLLLVEVVVRCQGKVARP